MKTIQNRARELTEKYSIHTTPVPIWSLEEMIHDQGYDIHVCQDHNHACLFFGKVIIPYQSDRQYRTMLAHELGHITIHPCYERYSYSCNRELQADIFASMLLIPPGTLEYNARIYNEHDLCDIYGITLDSMRLRLQIAQQLAK